MSEKSGFVLSKSPEKITWEAEDTNTTSEACVRRQPLSRWMVLGIGTLGAALGWESDLIKSARADQPPIVSPHKPERPGPKGAPTAPEQRREREPAYKILFDDTIKAKGIKRPVHLVIGSKPLTEFGQGISDFSIGLIVQDTIQTIEKEIEPKQKGKSANESPYEVLVTLERKTYAVTGVGKEVPKEKMTAVIRGAVQDMFRSIVPPEIAKKEPGIVVNFPTNGEHLDDLYDDVSRHNQIVINVMEGVESELHGNVEIRTSKEVTEYQSRWTTKWLDTAWANLPPTIISKDQKVVDVSYRRSGIFVVLEGMRKSFGNDIMTTIQEVGPAEVLHILTDTVSNQQETRELKSLSSATLQAQREVLDRNIRRNEGVVHAAIRAWFRDYTKHLRLPVVPQMAQKGNMHPEAFPVMRSAPPTLAGARQILLRYVQHPEQIDKLIGKK